MVSGENWARAYLKNDRKDAQMTAVRDYGQEEDHTRVAEQSKSYNGSARLADDATDAT
jgi:hypothetical protein